MTTKFSGDGSLYFESGVDTAKFTRDIQRMEKQITGMTRTAGAEADKMNQLFQRAGAAMAAYFSLQATKNFIGDVVRVRGEFQQLNVAFETMLGSREKADKLMADVVDFAAKTPFELTDLAQATKSLLAFGYTSEEVMKDIKALGDVSAGLSVPIGRLILNLGQVKSVGKLTGRELRDFQIAGVPIVAELAKNLNKAEDEIAEMVTAGKIGFKEVQDAFRSMSAEGGRFANLMDKQSATITGRISNLQDAWDRMLNSIGKANEGTINQAIDAAGYAVEHYEEILSIIKLLIATLGTYKAATIAVAVAQKAAVAAGNIQAWFQLARGIKSAKDAQIAFNLATKANPYVLAATAIAALVTTLVIFNRRKKEASIISQEFATNLTKEKKALEDTFENAANANTAYGQKKKAIEEINDKYGDYLDNLLTEKSSLEDIKKAQEQATKALVEGMLAKSMEADNAKFADETAKQEKKLNESFNKIINSLELTPEQKGQLSAQISKIQEEYFNGVIDFSGVSDRLRSAIGQLGADVSLLDFSKDKISTDQLDNLYESIINTVDAQKAQEKATNDSKKAYESYLKELGIITDSEDDSKKKKKELLTVQQQVLETQKELQKAEQSLANMRKSGSTSTVKDIQDQEAVVKELEKKLQALTGEEKKKAELKDDPVTQMLENRAEEYEKYYAVVKAMGKTFADQQFEGLLQEGRDYQEYLEKKLVEYRGFVNEQIKIAQAAHKAGINLIPRLIATVGGEGTQVKSKEAGIDTGLETSKLAKKIRDNKRKADKASIFDKEDLIEYADELFNVANGFNEIAGYVGKIDEDLGNALGTMADVAGSFGNLLMGLAPGGNPIQAITGAIGIITTLIDASVTKMEQLNELIDYNNFIIERQIKALQDLQGGEIISGQLDIFRNIKNQMGLLDEQADELTIKWQARSPVFFGLFHVWETIKKQTVESMDELTELLESEETAAKLADGLRIKDFSELEEMVNQYEAFKDQLKEIEYQVQEILTGSTHDTLVDAIAAGFRDGKSSIADFADTFEDYMKDAVMQSFKLSYLDDEIENWYRDFTEKSDSGGRLTKEEIEDLRKLYDEILSKASNKFDELESIAGIDFGADAARQQGLAGRIQALTEETGGMIAGQFFAFREIQQKIYLNNVEQLDVLNQSISHLSDLVHNTRHNSNLPEIKEGIIDMRNYLKQQF